MSSSTSCDRRIIWEPERRDIDEAGWHHRWGYELTPDGDGWTIVTEIFDCTRAPEEGKQAVKGGRAWIDSMTATLDRLDQLCTRRAPGVRPRRLSPRFLLIRRRRRRPAARASAAGRRRSSGSR